MKPTKDTIENIIKMTNGRFFRLEFVKNDGQVRLANTKEKDLRSLRGGKNKVRDAGYMVAYDRNKRKHISFRPESVIRIKCGNVDFKV